MKSKKLLLGSLSAMALVATPIAAVVSCSKGDDKVSETTVKGFLVGDGFYVPEALATKAGSFTISEGTHVVTYTWEKALKVGEKIKMKEGTKDATEIDVKAAAADHFVLPLTGKSGVGLYLTKDELKAKFEDYLGIKSKTGELGINIDPKVEADKVTDIGINDINAFLKDSGLVVESATAKEVAASGDTPKHYKYTLVWKK